MSALAAVSNLAPILLAGAAAGGNVTLALSGSAVTVSAGSLTEAIDYPLGGSAVTASAGSVTPGMALSGSEAASSAGTLVAAVTQAIAGSEATSSAGNVTPGLRLVGQEVTAFAGTVTAETGAVVDLVGSAVTVSAGTLTALATQSTNQFAGPGKRSWYRFKGRSVHATPYEIARLVHEDNAVREQVQVKRTKRHRTVSRQEWAQIMGSLVNLGSAGAAVEIDSYDDDEDAIEALLMAI